VRLARRTEAAGPSGGNHFRHAAIRPEDLVVSRSAAPPEGASTYRGKVSAVLGCGFGHEVYVQAGNLAFTARLTRRALIDEKITEGADVFVSFDPAALHIW